MRAVDTNVLVRLITRDDARQASSADAFIAKGAWVPLLALTEAIWVLAAVYKRSAKGLATGIEMLLHHEHLVLQDSDAVAAALDLFRSRPSLSPFARMRGTIAASGNSASTSATRWKNYSKPARKYSSALTRHPIVWGSARFAGISIARLPGAMRNPLFM
jgi:predicted nucleic-acid-binding protein